MSLSLSTQEAAEVLGCTAATVRRLIAQGQLTATQVKRGTRFAWQIARVDVDTYVETHGSYRRRGGALHARVAALEQLLSVDAAETRNAPLAAENMRLRERVADLEETLVRTRAAFELSHQADVARGRTVELLSEAIGANEQADQLRRQAAAEMEEALANFTRGASMTDL